MVRLDMSEYMEKHSVSRLIGAPPGYVGYDEGGALTEAVRRRPYQVVLFDEIEKAHPDVFNVLLQVLDDGRLTDGQGRTVDFRNTLIIMTSEPRFGVPGEPAGRRGHVSGARAGDGHGAERISGPNSSTASTRSSCSTACRRARWAGSSRSSSPGCRSCLEDRKITLTLDDAMRATGWRPRAGIPAYGARPLKRVIQRSLQDPLAEMILAGDIKDGDKVVDLLGG